MYQQRPHREHSALWHAALDVILTDNSVSHNNRNHRLARDPILEDLGFVERFGGRSYRNLGPQNSEIRQPSVDLMPQGSVLILISFRSRAQRHRFRIAQRTDAGFEDIY